MPQLGQRSRDPMQAEDGSIWYAGQFGNLMGNINPATGAIKEYELPANAKPHTVELDAKGNVWYTGNSNGSLGYLDPKTGKITVFKMPDPKAKDPHTLVFDKKGIGWFTLQNSNMVGRIDPASGDIKLVTLSDAGLASPTASRSTPRAIPGSPATARPASTRSMRRPWR